MIDDSCIVDTIPIRVLVNSIRTGWWLPSVSVLTHLKKSVVDNNSEQIICFEWLFHLQNQQMSDWINLAPIIQLNVAFDETLTEALSEQFIYPTVLLIQGLVRAVTPNKTGTCLLCNCSAIVSSQGSLFHLLIEPDNALVSSTRLMVLRTTKSDVVMQTVTVFWINWFVVKITGDTECGSVALKCSGHDEGSDGVHYQSF